MVRRRNNAVARAVVNAMAQGTSARRRAGPTIVVQAPPTGRKARRTRNRRRVRNRRIRGGFGQTELELQNLIGGGNDSMVPGLGPMARSEAVPNQNYEPMSPQFVGRSGGGLAALVASELGTTTAGQRWALKALHPNGESVTASAGIPDHTHVPVVTPEYRSNFTVSQTSAAVGTNDDVDIIVPPVPDIAFMYRRYPSGSKPPDASNWNVVYYAAFPTADDDVKLEDDDDTEFTATIRNSNFGGTYSRARSMYKGLTVHLDAPTLYDQGRLVAGQIAVDSEVIALELSLNDKATGAAHDVDGIPTISFAREFPLTEDALFQVSPGSVVWEAREGVYLPMRFREPVHLFNDTGPGRGASAVPYSVKILAVGRDAMSTGAGTAPGQVYFSGAGVDNTLTGIVLLRGISNIANLTVKARAGVEAQVDTVSPVSPFQHASPPLDQYAIDSVTRVAQTTPLAYVASMNDMSGILGWIKSAISNFVKPAAGILGGLGIPVVSDVAGGVGTIISALGLAPTRARRMMRAMGVMRR